MEIYPIQNKLLKVKNSDRHTNININGRVYEHIGRVRLCLRKNAQSPMNTAICQD